MNLDQFIAHAESDVSTVEFDSAAYLRNGLVTNSPFPEQDAHHWEYVRFVGREGNTHFYFRSYKWYENFSATILERVNDLAFDDNVASFILTLTTDAKLITRAEYTDASNDPNWSVFHTISFYPREDVPIWMKSDCILGIHTFPVGTSRPGCQAADDCGCSSFDRYKLKITTHAHYIFQTWKLLSTTADTIESKE